MAVKVKINTTEAKETLAFEQSQHCAVRAPNGVLWTVYTDFNGLTGDLLIAYSSDGGATWTEEVAVASARAVGYQCLGLQVDSNNVPSIIYGYDPVVGGNEFRYVDREGGAWGVPETIVAIATVGTPIIMKACIDSLDIIHMAYTQRIPAPAYQTEYATGVKGSWTTGELVDDADFPYDITVNNSNEPIVVFDTFLRVRTAGVWAAADTFDPTGGGWYAKIAIDTDDNYHVIWEGLAAGFNELYYRRKTLGAWEAVIVVVSSNVDDWSTPIIVLDTDDDAYVIYQYDRGAADETVWHKKITAGVLGAQQVLDAAILQPNTYPSTYTGLWHRFPASGILGASYQPIVVLLDEVPVGFPYADLYFYAGAYLPMLAGSGGNPGVVELLT